MLWISAGRSEAPRFEIKKKCSFFVLLRRKWVYRFTSYLGKKVQNLKFSVPRKFCMLHLTEIYCWKKERKK